MPPLLLALIFSQTSATPVLVAAPDFSGVRMDAELVSFYSAHFAQELQRSGLRIITSKDMAAVIGLERQKELMRCAESAPTCILELTSALGAEALVSGEIANLGGFHQVNLRIVSAKDGSALSTRTVRAEGPDELLSALSRAAAEMGPAAASALGRPLSVASTHTSAATRRVGWWWIPAASGGALAAVGAGLLLDSKGRFDAVATSQQSFTRPELESYVRGGEASRTIGLVGVGVGLAAVATGAGLFLGLGADEQVHLGALAGPSQWGVAVSGVLP